MKNKRRETNNINLGRVGLVVFMVVVFAGLVLFTARPQSAQQKCEASGKLYIPDAPGNKCRQRCTQSDLCDLTKKDQPCKYRSAGDDIKCMNCDRKDGKDQIVYNNACTPICANDNDCSKGGCRQIKGKNTSVCKKTQWWGVPAKSGKGSVCIEKDTTDSNPPGNHIGPYDNLKLCIRKNNCTWPYKFNADNTDCNTLPCTKNALGGWGSSKPGEKSTTYLYQKPQKKIASDIAKYYVDQYTDDDETKVGTCFKTYKIENGEEVGTPPQVPVNDKECNNQLTEEKCENAAFPNGDERVPHCKWYPAGSCLRIPKMLDPPSLDFDKSDSGGFTAGVIIDNKQLSDLDKNKKAKQTDFPNFYGGHGQNWLTDYPKVLDYDPTISNCKHKLMAQGAAEDEAAKLCGNFNEEEEFNPLEFRRCAGVVANVDSQYPTFHTTTQPFFVKKLTPDQIKYAQDNPRTYKTENISPSPTSAPTSKDPAWNDLPCVQLIKKPNTPCDGSRECIQQAQTRCDTTPDCNGFFYYSSGRWCPKSSYIPDAKNKPLPGGTFYYTDTPTQYTPGLVVSLGSPDGNIGVQNTNVYCARGASCAGRDADAVKAAFDSNILGQTKDNTLFPVVDSYCSDCTLTPAGERSNNWCWASDESNSKWSTSKNLKKVTMTTDTGIAKGRDPNSCFDNWYKDYDDACGVK